MATLWLGMCAVPAMAQKNIDKIVKELEKRDDVSISLVTHRNPETRKVTTVVKSITFTDEKISERLIQAFNKDEEYTVTAIKDSKKVNGKPKASYMYIFRTDEGQYKYALDVRRNGKTDLSVIFSPKKEGKEGKAVSQAGFDFIDLKEFEAEAKEVSVDYLYRKGDIVVRLVINNVVNNVKIKIDDEMISEHQYPIEFYSNFGGNYEGNDALFGGEKQAYSIPGNKFSLLNLE